MGSTSRMKTGLATTTVLEHAKACCGCRRLLQNPSYYGLADTEEATLSGYLSRMVENIFTALQACTLYCTPRTKIQCLVPHACCGPALRYR